MSSATETQRQSTGGERPKTGSAPPPPSSSSPASSSAASSPKKSGGQVVNSIGHYDMDKNIGEGNFAKVRLAKHTITGQQVTFIINYSIIDNR